MSDKKGMLLASEVLKIVLGVIGIALLVYLLISLYFAKIDSERLIYAEATVGRVLEIVNEFDFDSSFEGIITEVTPAGWSLFSFTGNNVKPDSCSGRDCLCICDQANQFKGYFRKYSQQRECNKKGFCGIVNNLKDFGEIEIISVGSGGLDLSVKKDGKWVEVKAI